MHVVIINGSPRVQKYSNTDKIIAVFAKGLSEKGNTFETYAISNRKTWDIIRDAYIKNDEILIALPLYVECVPGLLLEFLLSLKTMSVQGFHSFCRAASQRGASFAAARRFW